MNLTTTTADLHFTDRIKIVSTAKSSAIVFGSFL